MSSLFSHTASGDTPRNALFTYMHISSCRRDCLIDLPAKTRLTCDWLAETAFAI